MEKQELKKSPIQLNFLDKALAYISPKQATKRLAERVKYDSSVNFLRNQGYVTNISNQRNMRGWNATANSVDVDILPKRQSIVACSRDLNMNSPIARGILSRMVTNTIGLGLRYKAQIDREFLGFTGELGSENADKWETNVEREWLTWSNSIYSDAELTHTINENATLSFFNRALSGDVFIGLPGVKLPGQIYDTKVKVIESDFVSNPTNIMETHKIAHGVEYNVHGAPIAYYFRTPDPNSSIDLGPMGFDSWERIPRFNDQGLQQILHLFKKERPGQRRGVGVLAVVIEEIKEMTRYRGAELDAAILNSFYTVFIKSQDNISGQQMQEGYHPPTIENPLGINTNSVVTKNGDPRNENLYEMGKANILEMDAGQDITLADPAHPISGYDKFFEAIVQEISAGVGIPYEILMQRFNSSFSASKAALQEAWKMFLEERKFMIDHYYRPIFETFMVEAIAKGRIVAPGFFSDPTIRAAWLKSQWIGSGQGMIDPKKETEAAVLRINNRLTTYEKEYQSSNTGNDGDWQGAMANFAKEDKLLEDLDIKPEGINSEDETDNLPDNSNNSSNQLEDNSDEE